MRKNLEDFTSEKISAFLSKPLFDEDIILGKHPYWPKMSIVTPSFNQAEFLERTILSVLNQYYPNLEYIIIDGGSTDESVNIIQKYSNQLRFWCSETDYGPAAGLNKGFQRATGDIFSYLNADDFYLPNAFRTVVQAFNKYPNSKVLYGHGYHANAEDQLIRKVYSDNWNLRLYAYRACMILQQATFIRSEAFKKVGGFNEENTTCWDGELLVDLACSAAEFRRINKRLAAFRIHSKSITGSGRLKAKHLADRRRIFQKITGKPADAICGWHRQLALIEKRLFNPEITLRKVFKIIFNKSRVLNTYKLYK